MAKSAHLISQLTYSGTVTSAAYPFCTELAFWFWSHRCKQEMTAGFQEACWFYKIFSIHSHVKAGTVEKLLGHSSIHTLSESAGCLLFLHVFVKTLDISLGDSKRVAFLYIWIRSSWRAFPVLGLHNFFLFPGQETNVKITWVGRYLPPKMDEFLLFFPSEFYSARNVQHQHHLRAYWRCRTISSILAPEWESQYFRNIPMSFICKLKFEKHCCRNCFYSTNEFFILLIWLLICDQKKGQGHVYSPMHLYLLCRAWYIADTQ